MRRISGLVLAASLLLPLSLAHAAEVTQIYTNNLFADANSTDDAGVSTSVDVTREKGKGGFRDSIFIGISRPDGSFSMLQGTLPKGALRINANNASLEVNVADIVSSFEVDFPAEGVVSLQWRATGVTRTSGGTRFVSGNMTFMLVGTSTQSDAAITGSVLGTDMVAPTGDLHLAHESLIIHVSTP